MKSSASIQPSAPMLNAPRTTLPKDTSPTLAPTQSISSDIPYFESYTHSMLAEKLLAHFIDLEVPSAKTSNSFRLDELKSMARGKLHDGRDATQEQVELAKQVINRPELVKSLFGSHSGNVTWDQVALIAGDFKSLSDAALLDQARIYFREFAKGPKDHYVNFNELREAARQTRSTRHFSYNATKVAQELLKRPDLLWDLDTKPVSLSRPSKPDNRFGLGSIFYSEDWVSTSPRRPG